MARPLRIEYPGAFYHVTSRGNEGKKIYNSDKDKERFLHYLNNAHQRFGILIHAYCLMGNHYHLLVETPLPNLSRSMQFINSSYTTYYNLKNKRSGHLFQGRYKAIIVDKDSYAQVLSRYIHLNPVRSKITSTPEEYLWSSYNYYLHPGNKPEFLRIEFILGYFSSRKDSGQKGFKEFVEEGLTGKSANPFKEVVAGLILGSKSFVQKIKEGYLDHGKKTRDLPSLRRLKTEHVSSERIVNLIKKDHDLDEKDHLKMTVYFLRKYSANTLAEISTLLDNRVSASAVSRCFSRLEEKRKKDDWLDRKLRSLEGVLLYAET